MVQLMCILRKEHNSHLPLPPHPLPPLLILCSLSSPVAESQWSSGERPETGAPQWESALHQSGHQPALQNMALQLTVQHT